MTPVKAWRVVDPKGKVILPFAKTRADALTHIEVFNTIPRATWHRLVNASRREAGWGMIEVAGWKVEPIHPKGKR